LVGSVVLIFLLVVFTLFFVLFKWALSVGFIISEPGGQSLHFRIASEELLYCQARGRCWRVLRLRLFIASKTTSLLVVTAASGVFSARILSLVFCPQIQILLFSEILFDLFLFMPQILLVVLFSESLVLASESFLFISFKVFVVARRFVVLFPGFLTWGLTGVEMGLEVGELAELAVDSLVGRHRVGIVVRSVGRSLGFSLLAASQVWSL